MVGPNSSPGSVSRHSRWFLAFTLLLVLAVAWVPQARSQGTPEAVPDTLRALEQKAAADSSYDNLYRLGVAYLDRDRAVEAVRIFRRCTELEPKQIKSWVNYGASLDAIGHGGEARVAYRQALSLNSDDEIALCRLAASLYAGSYKSAAMDTLRLTVSRYPESYCAYFTLGVAFADAQIYQEAIRAWEKVVEFAPDTPEAESARESISTLRQLLRAQ